MAKPTSVHFEFAETGSFYDDEDEWVEELDTPFEHVATQPRVASAEYYSEAVELMIVLKDPETGILWGAVHRADSWHEEPWDIDDDDIFEVEERDVTIRQYVSK